MAPPFARDQQERRPLLQGHSTNPTPQYDAVRNGSSSADGQSNLITRSTGASSARRTIKPNPSDLTVKIQAICPNIHCPSCISHLETLVLTLSFDPSSQARIGNVETSLIDRSVNIELIISPSGRGRNIPPRAISKLHLGLLRELASILAEDGFPVDHLRSKLSSGVRADRAYKDAVHFVLDASDLYDKEKESSSQSAHSLPNNTHTRSDFGAPRPSSILGTFPASLGSTLRSTWTRSATQDAVRLQQQRWLKHIQICEACRDGVSGDTNQHTPLPKHADDAEYGSQLATGGVKGDGSNETKKRVMATFSISGMTCASCAQSITRAVQSDTSIPVDSIDVNVMAASATVITHPSAVSKVAETIDDAGFEANLVKTGPVHKPRSEDNVETSNSNWIAKLSVQGMTCASCVQSITSALKSFAEESNPKNAVKILETSVNLMGKSADVNLFTNPEAAVGKAEVEQRAKEVVNEIEDIGFDAELLNVQQNQSSQEGAGNGGKSGSEGRSVRIKVEGMFCEHCVAKVREYFANIRAEYPSDIDVNDEDLEEFTLSKPFLSFSYQSSADSHIRLRKLLEDINQLDPAFAAQYSPPASVASRSAVLARKELRDLLLRLTIAALFAIPSLVISMIAPLLPPDHPLRRYLSGYVLGSATRGEVAMWIISTPVQFGVGSIFFKKAWRSLSSVWKKGRSWTDRFMRFGNMDVLVALGTLVAYTSSLAFLVLDATRRPQDQHKLRLIFVKSGEDSGKAGMQNEMGMTYFEVSVFLVFFILLGRALESISKKKTGDAVADLGKMKPSSAYLVLDASKLAQSKTEVVDVDMLEIGDYALVPYGSSPPLDGTFAGTSTGKQDAQGLLDESSLSGEARPVTKKVGDELFAGTINVSPNAIFVRIGVLPGSCMIDEILDVVQESAGKKASIAQLADKITGVFVPVIVYVSLLVFILWTILLYGGGLNDGWQARHVPHYGEAGARFLWALQFGISCLLVACPCGIGLAAPTSQLAGIGLASKHGILVNGGGEAFRAASAAARGNAELVVVFDKTGTITKGEAVKVTSHRFAPAYESSGSGSLDQTTLLRCIDLVEQSSTHPYATAVRSFIAATLGQENPTDKASSRLPRLVDVSEVAGKGVRATFNSDKEKGASFRLLIGNKRLMDEMEGAYVGMDKSIKEAEQQWWDAANSVIYIGIQACSTASNESGAIGLALAIADVIRPEAGWVVEHLQQRFSAEVWMVSGDNEATARGVASQVGIPASHVVAGVLPVQKKEWVEKLQLHASQRELEHPAQTTTASHRRSWWWWRRAPATRKRIVCFVGDGINDSPALSSASLGIALGSGSSIAHSSSDFILLRRHTPLLSLPLLLSLSDATYFKIWTNFAWAFVFNLCLIPIAAGALVGVGLGLGPALSGLAMAFSSTSVVLNSLTLRWWTPERQVRQQIEQSQTEEEHGEQ